MTYGPFEALEASESEHRIASNAAAQTMDVAIVAVKRQHAAYLNASAHQGDFYDRLKNVKPDMRKILEAHGVHPAAGPMNKVIKACRDEARSHWSRSASGSAVQDAAPPTDLAAPVGVLEDSPIGAVASRHALRCASSDDWEKDYDRESEEELHRRHEDRGGEGNADPREFWKDSRQANADAPGYETQYGMPAGEVTNTTATDQQLASRRVGGGFRDFLEQGTRGLAEGMEPGPDEGGMGAFFQGLDSGIEGELPSELAHPQHPPLPRGHGDHDWKQEFGEGMSSGMGRGFRGSNEEQAGGNEEFYHEPKPPRPRKPTQHGPEYSQEGHYGSISDRQYLAALITGEFEENHTSLDTALIPEGDFDAYLNQVTDPAADAASTNPFGERDGEHDWENTGGKQSSRAFLAALKESIGIGGQLPGQGMGLPQPMTPKTYTPQRLPGVAKPRRPAPGEPQSDFNFTGSPETQYHHRQGPWRSEGDFDQDAMYRQQRAAARHYHAWCGQNRLITRSAKNLHHFASKVPLAEATAFLGAIREAHAQKQYRLAAGKDHLQTSQDAITKMLNELAEDFQKSIVPLQDALQSVSFAQQSMQAQSPMNVMPPGSVNVMPEGMQDPNAAAAGMAPPMQGQSMPAQPGPGGLSPMVDPAATGGAPAAPAPGGGGGDPLAALPPEVLQALMGAGGGGAPAPGGAPAQRPVARRRLFADEFDPSTITSAPGMDEGSLGLPGAGEAIGWSQLENGSPLRPEARHRLYAEFPPGGFGDGGGEEKKDEPPKDDKPKDDGPPKSDGPPSDGPPKGGDEKPPGDGPPEDQGPPAEGGGEGEDQAVVLESVIALLDAGDLEAAQALAQQFDITDEDVNSYAPSDPYETGDPYGAPAPAGPPPGPPPEAGGFPPEAAAGPPPAPPGPPVPPDAGMPPEMVASRRRADRDMFAPFGGGGSSSDGAQPFGGSAYAPLNGPNGNQPAPDPAGDIGQSLQRQAASYLRWASHHNLPINRQTVEMFHYANNNPVEESRQRQRSRRPLATARR